MVEAVQRGELGASLLLLEHPHVFSLGRGADGSNLLWSEERCAAEGVEIVRSDRGGDATYHGPGQLVGYPIVDLALLQLDVWQYVQVLEAALIGYLADLGVKSQAGPEGRAGVWSGEAKVAAIGVKLTRSVTSHGFALNLNPNLDIFNQGIVPCGLVGLRATSVRELKGISPDLDRAAQDLPPHLARCLGLELEWGRGQELDGLRSSQPSTSPRTLDPDPAD